MNNSEQPTSSTNASVGASSRGIVLVVVESYVFLALNLTALVGNALVCVAFYRKSSLRTVTNNFIASLALTDLLMAIFVMPLTASSSLTDEWNGGTFSLKIIGCCGNILEGTSLLTVMLLAINRYFRVVRPTLYRNIYSKKSSTVMAVTAWVVSAIMFGVGLTVFEVKFRPYPADPSIISPTFPSTSAFTFYVTVHNLLIGVPGLVIIACSLKIYQTIRHHNTAAAPPSQAGHSSHGVEEAKITRILTVVLIGFYLCWLPPFIADILYSLTLIEESSLKYYFYYSFPVYASSVINHLIYATLSRPFRMEFLQILRGQCFV